MEMAMDKLITDSEWEVVRYGNGVESAVKNVTPSVCLQVSSYWREVEHGGNEWDWCICWRHDLTRNIEQGSSSSAEEAFEQVLEAFRVLRETTLEEEARQSEARRKRKEGQAVLFAELEAAVARFNGE